MNEKNKNRVRLTVDLTSQFYQRLEELESLVGANRKADVIRDALRLYEYVCRRVIQNGDKFQAVGKAGEIDVNHPGYHVPQGLKAVDYLDRMIIDIPETVGSRLLDERGFRMFEASSNCSD